MRLPKPVTSVAVKRVGGTAFRVGFAEMNGWRPSMEDAHLIYTQDTWGCFGVFDGHGGDECSGFIARRFNEELDKTGMPESHEAVTELAFRLDEEFLNSNQPSGSTGTFVFVQAPSAPGGRYHLRVGNIGDSRILLGRADGSLVRGGGSDGALTKDHKPEAEEERIRRSGGNVQVMGATCRLNGCLAVSRAFGDKEHKNAGLSCAPDLQELDCDPNHFLVLVCDGISEGGFAPDAVVKLAAEKLRATPGDPAQAAIAVCDEAIKSGSTDNLSCMIVLLGGGEVPGEHADFIPGPFGAPESAAFKKAYASMAERSGFTLERALKKRAEDAALLKRRLLGQKPKTSARPVWRRRDAVGRSCRRGAWLAEHFVREVRSEPRVPSRGVLGVKLTICQRGRHAHRLTLRRIWTPQVAGFPEPISSSTVGCPTLLESLRHFSGRPNIQNATCRRNVLTEGVPATRKVGHRTVAWPNPLRPVPELRPNQQARYVVRPAVVGSRVVGAIPVQAPRRVPAGASSMPAFPDESSSVGLAAPKPRGPSHTVVPPKAPGPLNLAEGQWKIGTVLVKTATGFLVVPAAEVRRPFSLSTPTVKSPGPGLLAPPRAAGPAGFGVPLRAPLNRFVSPRPSAGALRPNFAPEMVIRPNFPLRPATAGPFEPPGRPQTQTLTDCLCSRSVLALHGAARKADLRCRDGRQAVSEKGTTMLSQWQFKSRNACQIAISFISALPSPKQFAQLDTKLLRLCELEWELSGAVLRAQDLGNELLLAAMQWHSFEGDSTVQSQLQPSFFDNFLGDQSTPRSGVPNLPEKTLTSCSQPDRRLSGSTGVPDTESDLESESESNPELKFANAQDSSLECQNGHRKVFLNRAAEADWYVDQACGCLAQAPERSRLEVASPEQVQAARADGVDYAPDGKDSPGALWADAEEFRPPRVQIVQMLKEIGRRDEEDSDPSPAGSDDQKASSCSHNALAHETRISQLSAVFELDAQLSKTCEEQSKQIQQLTVQLQMKNQQHEDLQEQWQAAKEELQDKLKDATAQLSDAEERCKKYQAEKAYKDALKNASRQLCEIEEMSSPEVRDKAFKKLLQVWHPDKNLDNVQVATKVFQFLQRWKP
ncbi:unnamed protein product [Symbiodinium sp. CCMP2592]|nr:unnamed protein product [Symbiodinium sp. CCMP2592]